MPVWGVGSIFVEIVESIAKAHPRDRRLGLPWFLLLFDPYFSCSGCGGHGDQADAWDHVGQAAAAPC